MFIGIAAFWLFAVVMVGFIFGAGRLVEYIDGRYDNTIFSIVSASLLFLIFLELFMNGLVLLLQL